MNLPENDSRRDEVLNAFAAEPDHGRATLERYLEQHPDLAEDLIDLSREISRFSLSAPQSLTGADESMIAAAWQRHLAAGTKAADPLANLSVEILRELAMQLEVPRVIIAAFRERRVELDSVPLPFFETLAASLRTPLRELKAALALPAAFARSHKSDTKPQPKQKVTFEQLLIEANVPEARRAALLRS